MTALIEHKGKVLKIEYTNEPIVKDSVSHDGEHIQKTETEPMIRSVNEILRNNLDQDFISELELFI